MHPNYNSDPKQAPQGGAYGYQQAAPPHGVPPQAATYNYQQQGPPQGGVYGYPQGVPPQAAPPQGVPPQAATYSYQQQGPPQWTTGLCGCFEDPGSCMMACCCPCITFGQNAEIIDKGTTSCAFGGLIYFALAYVGCACLYSFSFRSKLRGLYALPEDPCADCCVHCLLPCCAISQEYRELKNRGLDPSIGWIANAQKMNQGGNPAPPYVTPGMYR